ncbi:MAG: ABC transporter substrate-binding protein [Polaromonas sp.]|nr:ABC transporter substrate-binding protein [Polaromonas sp.]
MFSTQSNLAKNGFRLLAASLLSCTAAVALAQTAPASTAIRIGVIAPLSGPSADFGVPMLNGVKLAVDEINAAGGYLGRKIELLVRDDEANPDKGRKASEDLATQKVMAAIGFCNTGVAAKSLDVFQTQKIPLIIPCATGTHLTATYPAPESYIFRTSAKDAVQAGFVVDDIVKRGWTKVAVFADNTPYGDSGLKDVIAALARYKLTPVHIARFPLGVRDVTADLKTARDVGANAVFSYSLGPESVAIAHGRKALGWKVPQVGAWPLSFPAYIDGAKEAAEDTLMAQTFIVEQRGNERRTAFLNGYMAKYHLKSVPAAIPAAQAYDSTYLLLYSLFGVKGTADGPAIKASLENLSKIYYGAVATYDNPFSPSDKDAFTPNMLLLGQIKDGAVTYAYPADIKRNLFVQRKKQ